MALITVTAVKINEDTFTVAKSMQIEDVNIKYVYQLGAYTQIQYYDQMSAKLTELLVTETPKEIWDLFTGFILITAERIDTIDNIKAMLINKNSFGYSVALSPKDAASLAIIPYGTLVGTFQVNEVITGGTLKATAKIVTDDGAGLMVVHPINGTLAAAEIITGATSAAHAVVTSYTAAAQKFMQYQNGQSVARKKKDIVAYLAGGTLNYAITAVSLTNNTFRVAGNHQAVLTRDVPFFVDGSTGNDGLYTVVASTVTGGNTFITVLQKIPVATVDGTIIDA